MFIGATKEIGVCKEVRKEAQLPLMWNYTFASNKERAVKRNIEWDERETGTHKYT